MALSTWTIFFTWIEQMGKFELTVSQNIRAIYFLAFVPIVGFAATTKTYISQYIRKQDIASLKIIQRRIQLLTVVSLFVFFHGAVFYPKQRLISVKFQTINGSGNTIASFFIELISVSTYMVFSYLLIKVWKLDIFWVWSVEYIYFGTLGVLSISYLKLFNWKKKNI